MLGCRRSQNCPAFAVLFCAQETAAGHIFYLRLFACNISGHGRMHFLSVYMQGWLLALKI